MRAFLIFFVIINFKIFSLHSESIAFKCDCLEGYNLLFSEEYTTLKLKDERKKKECTHGNNISAVIDIENETLNGHSYKKKYYKVNISDELIYFEYNTLSSNKPDADKVQWFNAFNRYTGLYEIIWNFHPTAKLGENHYHFKETIGSRYQCKKADKLL